MWDSISQLVQQVRGWLVLALALLAAVIGAGVAQGELSQSGNLRLSFDGGFVPLALPRDRLAPVDFEVEGKISTTDGTHPPALRRVRIALNGNGKLSTAGLPRCRSGVLQSTSPAGALAACRGALVGRGTLQATVALDGNDEVHVAGSILAFNGRRAGRQSLLLHLYVAVPVSATLVLPLTISHRPNQRFGTVLSGTVPRLAGGLGSITEMHLKVGRTYRSAGKRRSYLSASCAAPAGFSTAVFPFARGTFYFVGGKRIVTALTRQCHVR
jgi:hypothetical protein